ncbi:hypothetical protein [Streptomyces sp. NPDC057682]|uniref:hypothetical protein n=1 Tax=Streptomyces sp. NPDC057682 TaxID=3346210 RepID=UPI0036946315
MPDPATVPVTLTLPPAAARALFADPGDTPLKTVRRQIAAGQTPDDARPVPLTTAVAPQLLQQARDAAGERGMTLDQAVEDLLLHAPVLLVPAHIARVLGVERPHLTAPSPTNQPPRPGEPGLGRQTALGRTWQMAIKVWERRQWLMRLVVRLH